MTVPVLEQCQDWERNWVDSVIADGRSTYDETFSLIQHIRRMRSLRLRGKVPRSFAKVMGSGIRAPMSWTHVQTIVGMIAKNRPTFERLPRSRREAESAQRLVNTAGPTLDSLERAAHKPLFTLFADQLAGDGRGQLKIRMTPWEGYPIQLEGEADGKYNRRVDQWLAETSSQPFRVQLVDALNFMPSREEWDTGYVIEQGERNTLKTMERFNLSFGTNNRLSQLSELPRGRAHAQLTLPGGIGPTVPVEEVWTEEYVYIRINGDHYKMKNQLGFLPYVWRNGEQTSIPDPALEGVSSIFPFIGIEPWLNTTLSVIAAWAILGSTPILWTSRDATAVAPAGRPAVSDIPLGKKVDLGPGGKIGFVEPPGVGREVIEFANLLLSFYEKAGVTPLARGLAGTRTAGLTMSASLEAATDKLKPTIFSLEDGTSELVEKLWRIVYDVIKKPVSVTGVGPVTEMMGLRTKEKRSRFIIDPDDIRGYYDVKATVKLANLQDIISQGMHASFMVAHRLWSRERGMRFATVDDPFEEYKQILREEFRDDPMVKEVLKQNALAEEPELMAALQQLIAAGQANIDEMGGAIGGGGAPANEGVFGGAPQPRGGGSPQAGGRPAGSPRRPTGPRGTNTPQGQQFPK